MVILICIHLSYILVFASSALASKSMRLTFDNITTSSGLATIPSPYHLLSFSAYNIFRPRDPAFDDIITPHDYNCAVSPPNALLGSRLGSDSKGATFQIADNTALWEEGLHPYFDLKSFYIKPMDAPMPGTRMNVRGHRAGEEEELKWHVDFPSGYHPPFLVNLEEYSRKKWEKLTRVEITADFGEDRLDWEFCLDDLEVVFHKIGYDEGGGKRKASAGSRGQAVLARGM